MRMHIDAVADDGQWICDGIRPDIIEVGDDRVVHPLTDELSVHQTRRNAGTPMRAFHGGWADGTAAPSVSGGAAAHTTLSGSVKTWHRCPP